MIFVIPMAGEGRRFKNAGYLQEKYQLPLYGTPVFDFAVRSFAAYFKTDGFLFVVRGGEAENFVRERRAVLGIEHVGIVRLGRTTGGQAETVLCGLDEAEVPDEEPIAVFNIDTFRPGYRKSAFITDDRVDGYLEVFRGSGTNWSFIAPDPRNPACVGEVVEKRAISELCCTGLYYFRRTGDFRWAYSNPARARSAAEVRERYVAPLYNALITARRRIGYEVVAAEDTIFCGTPEEYTHILRSDAIRWRLPR